MAREPFFEEAARQLTICNACRYCEGYCGVFPALELRTELKLADVTYLANLCHDCQACLQACMYAPPHDFGVNIPAILQTAREASYVEYAWPRRVGSAVWYHPYLSVLISTMVGLGLAILVAFALGGAGLFGGRTGPGAFYSVIPWLAMLVPASVMSVFIIAVLTGSLATFWRSGRGAGGAPSPRVWWGAILDAGRLRYLGGGGPGCYYPDGRAPSASRRRFHHLVLYGFAGDFAATVAAAIQQDLLGQLPPYPLLSVPVLLGGLGGLALIIGCSGLIYIEFKAWRLTTDLPSPQDAAFLVLLNLVAITGMLLLAFRGTAAMGMLLSVHLATLVGLYFTLPYGKFVHGAYRFAALLRNRLEMSLDDRGRQVDQGFPAEN